MPVQAKSNQQTLRILQRLPRQKDEMLGSNLKPGTVSVLGQLQAPVAELLSTELALDRHFDSMQEYHFYVLANTCRSAEATFIQVRLPR